MRFVLGNGRTVRLVSLDQSLTYDGLLEGSVTVASNKTRVRAACTSGPSYLLDRSLLERYGSPIEPGDNFERTDRLPAIRCHAILRDHRPAVDHEAHGSELRIAWFQADFALPIDAAALASIHDLDWTRLATDYQV